jgi:PAS domain S-box-containing protein
MYTRAHDSPGLIRAEHSVARSLAEGDQSADVYPGVLAAIGEALGWRLGSVWEVDRERSPSIACAATWHAPGVDAEEFRRITEETRFGPGEGLPGRVWSSGEPAWIEDVTADPNFPRAAAAERAGLHAAVAFPIRSRNRMLGVIEFFSVEHREPDRRALETMASLGAQIGQFVERRRAEEAVREAGELKRAMLDAALDCVITIDHAGRVIDFNPAAQATFGYSAREVAGREMADLVVPPSLRERHRAGLARCVAAGGTGELLDQRFEITGMRADGSEFPVELTITRIDVPGPPKFTGYLRDITDRLAAQAELKASRARIVSAGDAERRRIERDLHDGAQQRLVAATLGLRLARRKLEQDADEGRRLLDEAIVDVVGATNELRELARGIHPSVLTEGGLGPALDSLVSGCPVAAELLAAPEGRLPQPVESAAYFTVAEALTNVVRYAGATRATVSATVNDGVLAVEVADDGRGGADAAGGSGLRGLSDRIAALEGTLAVFSQRGEGTRLRALIPCE